MDKLFLEMESQRLPISDEMIMKYDLKKGIRSPFTNALIVDINGDSALEREETAEKDFDGVKENQTIFTQSEALG